MASQNSPVQQLEAPIRTISPAKPSKSIKAPAVKAAVLVSRANGKAKREIARELGIGRPTVDKIIKEANLDQIMESGELGAFGMIHKSLDVLDQRLTKGSESAATYLLSNTLFSDRYSKKAAPPADVVVNLAIQNLIQPSTTTNSDTASNQPIDVPSAQVLEPDKQ